VSQSALYAAQTPVPITQAPIAPAPVAGAASYQANIPAAGAPVYVPPTDPLLGQVLAGRYLVEKKLGEGGMGAVYLATHTVLEKRVALKVLHGEFARKADLVERFMQEAKAASRIRHENVIDISDFGTAGEGVVFFAMELLKGHDLHEEVARARLAGQRLPWARTRPIFLQICSALAAAHAGGVVHRDLKPENIYLVEWLGHKDFVKLLDFGIAKLTEVTEGDRKLTRTGMLFGTPEYMSPEQARGEPVDHRVDVYAMGCILYQLVTGRVPFEADNFMGILSLHLTEEVPPIPPPIFAEIGGPPELEYIIQKAMAKAREDRYQSIDEMANAIRALHGEEERPIQAPRGPLATPAPRSPTRPKAEWTGSLSVPAETMVPERKPRSKAPWIILAVLAAGGGGAAAILMGGKKSGPGSGTDAPIAVVFDAGAATPGSAATPPQPPPPDEPPVVIPARVTLVLDSVPQGADIYDMTSKEVVGQTPMDFEVPGSKEPRRYTFKHKGYSGKMIELIPLENVTYKTELKKLAKGQHEEPAQLEVVPQKVRPKPLPGAGAAIVAGSVDAGVAAGSDDVPSTKPDPIAGSGGAHVDPTPGPGSAVHVDPTPGSGSAKPDPGPGSAVKPPDPGSGAGTDDDLPGLKGFPDPNK
jgi:serine/threonine-protein kinase